MVSTRSSARKPPNPPRPSSAPSRLPSHSTPVPVPVVDDILPSYPRRSPRIRLKHADTIPSRICSPDPPLSTSFPKLSQEAQHNENPQTTANLTDSERHPLPQDSTPFDATESLNPISPPSSGNRTAQHSDDEAPEEIKTVRAKSFPSGVGFPSATSKLEIASNESQKKRHRKRQRRRGRKDKCKSLKASPLQVESEFHITVPLEDPISPVGERLSKDAIAAAQSALDDVKMREQNAKEVALLGNQVRQTNKLSRSRQLGHAKVALLSGSHPGIRRASSKGRKSAASFLASCIQKGPRRVPSSKIAIMAASPKPFHAR